MKWMRALTVLVLYLILSTGNAWADRMAVLADVANIRTGPGSENEIVWKAEKYFPIMVIEIKGKWVHFRDYEDDEGWVHQSLVGKLDTVITKGKKNNVRSGPGTEFEIRFTVDDGIPFKVLQRKGAWIHIEHADGDQGWIHKSLVW